MNSGLIDQRTISAAVAEGFFLWIDDRYGRFLGKRRCHSLDADWFAWFLGEWNIARNVRKGKQEKVRQFFNLEFIDILAVNKNGVAIDLAAEVIRNRGYSSKAGTKKIAVLPVSMVSKVSFFFYPATYTPYDRLGKTGLNMLRGKRADGGWGRSSFETYEEYLADFNYYFREYEGAIRAELDEHWPSELAEKLGMDTELLLTRAFRRKVFDNVLMSLGRS